MWKLLVLSCYTYNYFLTLGVLLQDLGHFGRPRFVAAASQKVSYNSIIIHIYL